MKPQRADTQLLLREADSDCSMQARVKTVEAQLAETRQQLAQLKTQQQELEIQNQLLESTVQSSSNTFIGPEEALLWKVSQLSCNPYALHFHLNIQHH